jgi:hypothetical protein
MSFCNSSSINHSIDSSNNSSNNNSNNNNNNSNNNRYNNSNSSIYNNSSSNMMLEGDDDDGQLEGFCQPCSFNVVRPALHGTIDKVEVGAMEPELATLHRVLDERIRQRV